LSALERRTIRPTARNGQVTCQEVEARISASDADKSAAA
jgi:hypothetical protein